MNLKIKPMKIEDARSVAEIHTKAWQFAYKGIVPQVFLDKLDVNQREKNWKQGFIEDPSLIRLVAKDENNSILGFVCGLECRGNNSQIDSELWAIYVSPEKTKCGIGNLLFKSFTQELKKRGFSKMNVWVLKDNKMARNFYEKMGGIQSEHTKEIDIGGKKLLELSYEYNL